MTAHAANVATAHGYGPFALAAGPDSHAITLLQIFLAITIMTSLALAALTANLTERVDLERLLAHEAAHDHLTGLPNRRELARRLDAALIAAGPLQGVALLFIDLDRFKVINDSLGHDWGDALLVHVAERLRDGARTRDVVARVGGDEFVVLCTHLAEPAEDDFGTGFASFSQLERIPFDIVKIDRSFVPPLESGHDGALRRLAAIVSLIHSFGMTAVAEGIETDAQEAAVRAAGCDLLQGFSLGRPLPLAQSTRTGGTDAPEPRAATTHGALGGASAGT